MGARGSIGYNAAAFSPEQVPQIAAGEFWLPGAGVSGTTTISWAGRNGTNTLATAAAEAPDAVTGPGGNPAWSYVAANSDTFVVASPAGPLTATDGVYVACWVRFDSLDTTNRVVVEQHGSAGARKWHLRKTASTTTLQLDVSQDGTTLQTQAVSLTEAEGAGSITMLDRYLFVEILIDPTVTSSVAAQSRLWVNMSPITFTNTTGAVVTSLFNGGALRYGNNNFQNQDFNGQLGPLYIGKRSSGRLLPTGKQRLKLMRYLAPRDGRIQVVLRGNSLTAGQGASDAATTGYPAVLRAAFTTRGYVGREVHDRGHGGDSTEFILQNFFSDEFLLLDKTFDRSVLVMFEVRNSTTAGRSAQEIYQTHVTYGNRARGAGYWFLACTAPPTDGDAAGQGVAGAANALIRANWQQFANGFVDLERVPELTPAGNVLNPTYYSDGVHLTDAGYAVIASRVLAAILT